tara:strand:- start:150 stop:773 length:624 start_codon:yes stop_codon:yes gene_type:complete
MELVMHPISSIDLMRAGISQRYPETATFSPKQSIEIVNYNQFKVIHNLFISFNCYSSTLYVSRVECLVEKAFSYSQLNEDEIKLHEIFLAVKAKQYSYVELQAIYRTLEASVKDIHGPVNLTSYSNGTSIFLSYLLIYYISLSMIHEANYPDQDDIDFLHRVFLNLMGIHMELRHAQITAPIPEGLTLLELKQAIEIYTEVIESLEQ